MTASIISLFSIIVGILGANITGLLAKKYSLGLTGNTIVGVFGSIFLIKTFGRLGFSPQMILADGHVHYSLLLLNIFVSFCGGILAVLVGFKLKSFFDKKRD